MKQKEAELLLKATLESEKKERQRIAKDLHDSVQSDLSTVRNYITLISRKNNDLDIKDLIDASKAVLNQTTENTRLISYKLMPPLLETAGFSLAIIDYFEKLTESSGKKFSLQTELLDLNLSSEKAYELFRIIQEFTQNMLKHGAIEECKLFLYETNENISLEIVDDGIIFNFKLCYAQSKGSGLYNIQSRLTIISAELIQREVINGNHFVIYLKNEE